MLAAFSLYQHHPLNTAGAGPHGALHQVDSCQGLPVGGRGGNLVSVATQTLPAQSQQTHQTPEVGAVQEAGAVQEQASTPAAAAGKKGGKKVKPEKPGKAAPGEVLQPRPVLAPLAIPPGGTAACPDQAGAGGHPAVPPTPSPQQGDAMFMFPPALAL